MALWVHITSSRIVSLAYRVELRISPKETKKKDGDEWCGARSGGRERGAVIVLVWLGVGG